MKYFSLNNLIKPLLRFVCLQTYRDLISLCLILTMTTICSGQTNFNFKSLSKEDGLSQASVFAIAQDQSGFMWFGTRDGLNKYDGYQFKVYKNDHDDNKSLVANDIRSLYFDEYENLLWACSISGLSKYNSNQDNFQNFYHDPDDPTSVSNNVIRQVYRDSKRRLWVGTSIGLNLLDKSTDKFDRYYIDNSQALDNSKNDIKAILEDKSGTLWIGTANGLYELKTDKNGSFIFERTEIDQKGLLSDSHIKNILEDRDGNLWIGTFAGGINHWNRKTGQVTIFKNNRNDPNSLSHNNVRSLCIDKNNNLWVGTFDGLNLLKYNETIFKRFSKSEFGTAGLSDKSIRSIFSDQTGNLWIGSYYGGINHLDENYNRFKKNALVGNGLRGKVVSSFAQDENGNLWIGTEGDGLNFFDKSKKKFQNFLYSQTESNTISGNNVKDLLLDGDQLWIGTFQAGLNLYNIETGKFKYYTNDPINGNSLSENNVYGLLKEGELLYIVTYGGGLDILNLKTGLFTNFSHIINDYKSLSSDLARVILKTNNGQLWIGTERGINKVHVNAIGIPESFETILSHENIYCLTENNAGNIWVGTYSNGLYCLDPKTNDLKHFTTENGLPGNTVLGVLEVDKDELWISTNNGLSKFDPRNLIFTNYDYSNGLENSEYNYNAYLKDNNGDLLFGGLNGFTYFNPEDIQPNKFVPPIVFTDLRKNNEIVKVGDKSEILKQSINETEQITFNYKEANFSIGFAALDYFSPKSNQYSFILEGIDNEWNHSIGYTEATYTIQQPGKYVFKLKGGNSEGVWNNEERQLQVMVLPPLWKTSWAYLIYALILGTLLLGWYRFIKLQHNLQLEKLENQQQAELHEMKLRFFTNITHEFRTPLTLIIAPLNELLNKSNIATSVEKKLKTVEKNAQRMLNLVNQILTFRKLANDHTELSITKGNIVEFTQEIFLLFQESAIRKGINYQFESKRKVIHAWFDEDKLEKVIFNLISNAFKFTPVDENIIVKLSINKNYIELKISDSGVGIQEDQVNQIFKRFYAKSKDGQSTIKGSGIGLAISKQMVELHQGKIYLAGIEDNPFQKGSTFVVQLPRGKAHFNALFQKDSQSSVKILSQDKEQQNDLEILPDDHELIAIPSSGEKPKLLIVEDNKEVRNYVKSIFSPHFNVFSAKNGLDGYSITKKILPDIVISDVKMPVMDGIALCQKLKSDFEVSHIPVILLTARAASLFKIEGLKTGADDYITKPFNPDELRLRVENIIATRKIVRDKFKRLLTLDPKHLDISSTDEVFLENALKAVERNIDKYEFNVNMFATELAVSRPQLFNKIKALTGQTPNNFIKSIRMKRAAQLISSNKMNVSEVAYAVGFKDVKYFSKCFKVQFETPPSKYLKSQVD